MRIAFVSTMYGWPWGGSEELWSQTADYLGRAGHDVVAFVAFRRKLSAKVLALAHVGVKIDAYPSPGYIAGRARHLWDRITLATRRCFQRLRNFNPDLVVISQGHNSGGFEWAEICRQMDMPYVVIVHCNCEQWAFEDCAIEPAVAAYENARRVFCVSRGNLDLLRLQLGHPLKDAEIVWNPCNVSTDEAPEWPHENGVWRLACVARLDPLAKGQELLLQVLARPEWRERSVELDLFGEGIFEQALRRLAEMLKLPNVHFRGQVSDIRAIWKEHHLLVLPSRYEGLPLVLVEAMWCARPAVVTNVGGNAELCIDNETGFVAPAPTVELLAQTLERAWARRTEWREMGRAAREHVEHVMPQDPIALFAGKLQHLASNKQFHPFASAPANDLTDGSAQLVILESRSGSDPGTIKSGSTNI